MTQQTETTSAGRNPQADLQAFIETHHDDAIRELAKEDGVETLLTIPGVWEASEDDDIAELRTAVQVNVADGTIEPSDVLGEL